MRYMIYVKKGIYEEKVEVTKKKINLIIVGDGMYSTIITGSLNVVDGSTTFRSATLAAIGKGFILLTDLAGWAEWNRDFALETLYYSEYMNNRLGASTSKHVKWPGYHIITDPAEAMTFNVGELI
ncbi:Pectinesterase [Capsicum annuum]|nr:Pectinesterase [Capsicum annuum]